MLENSPAGLVMLNAEVPVTVTGEEHHQNVLARYPDGRVVVELRWCRIRSGKHRGQNAVEIRLDGHRVGELTFLMSQRYGPLLHQVSTQGGRPGAEAFVERGPRGAQVVLRLPRDHTETAPLARPVPVPPAAAAVPASPSAKRAWIAIGSAAAVLLLIGIIASTTGNSDDTPTANTASSQETTTAQAIAPVQVETTTVEVAPTTTTTTTTAPTTTQPAPPPPAKTTTKRTTKTATPPPAEPPPPSHGCDPNYTGCVPIASDVDCAGGSGNGPAYVKGPIMVIGKDIYGLDADHDGIACE